MWSPYLTQSPSYHQLSPLSRSPSQRRSSLTRAHSYTYGTGSTSSFLARAPSRSRFGRALVSSSLYYTPPLQTIAVQRASPHYSERFPHVRYSYADVDTGVGLLRQSASLSKNTYSLHSTPSRSYTQGNWSQSYTSSQPRYGRTSSYEGRSPQPAFRSHVNVDAAMDLYKNRCMTVGTLSKYWLTSSSLSNRHHRDLAGDTGMHSPYGSYSSYTPAYKSSYTAGYSSSYTRPGYTSGSGRYIGNRRY